MNPRTLLAELKRRNVYRGAVAYAAVAWLLIQIVTQVSPYFDIPGWSVRLMIVILVAGFPVAMVLAWIFEFTSGGLVRTENQSVAQPVAHGTRRNIDFAIIAVLLLAVAILVFDRLRPRDRGGIPDKSIAVLPFENMSDDNANAFFADGIQDDVLTSLTKISDLKVISRTSVMAYRGGTRGNLREIGRALGAAHILEGSVRRAGERVVVNVQLIDARNDHHVWANRYDRTLADALGLQGELAAEIADSLRATLSTEEKARVETKPTQNPEAYVLYLRARQYETSPDTLLQDYRLAEQFYSEAVGLDPSFALAHAHLATTRAALFHYYEPVDQHKRGAWASANEALRLQPNLSDAHAALALYYYWTERDYAHALPELAIAQSLAPSDANLGSLIAAIWRRQGKWQEALEKYRRIETLDPQNPNIARNLLFTATALRDWGEAARAAEKLRVLTPDSINSRIQLAYVDFSARGDITKLTQVLAAIPPESDPDGAVSAARWDVALIERDFATAGEVLRNSNLDAFSYLNGQQTPKEFMLGCVALASGDADRANASFEAARLKFESALAESPEAPERHANLGLLYAFMGRKEDAIREGRHAVELRPEAKDAFDGAIMNCYLAVIYARTDETDQAVTLIERLFKTPGAVDSTFYSITLADLRKRWVWDPLRGDPRFQKLISGD